MSRSLQALEFPELCRHLSHFAQTDQARERLAALAPSRELGWIADELTRVEEVRGLILRGGQWGGGDVRDIGALLLRASVSGSMLGAEDLLAIVHSLRVYASIRKTLDRNQERMPKVWKLAQPLQPLPHLESQIDQAITPEATVRDRASPELARIRHSLSIQQERIRSKVTGMIARLKKSGALRDDSFTLREGRYVLPVRSDSAHKVRGIIQDRSATGGTLFIEPLAIVELGNEIRTLELAERDEIRRILRDLTDHVRLNREQLEGNQSVMVALDCLWAKASLAERLDAVTPQLVPDGALRIIKGRHPLLLLKGEREVVPLNLELGGDYSAMVISGPNAGGKTVTIKCVGLLCLMAACGMPIPALPGTEIPLFERIHASIGDQQSLTDDLSTFTAHAQRLKEIVETAQQRTLVLIDEIGAGTDPQEGSSLSIAILEQLIARKVPTIVTTHHSALKAFAHNTAGCTNGSMEFDRQTLRPTYRFHPHLPGSSYALEIAARAGLPKQVIERAREVLGGEQARLEELIMNLTEQVRQYERLVAGEKRQEAEIKAYEEEYRRKLTQLQEREKGLRQRVMAQADELLSSARKQIEAAVKQIREREADQESIRKAHQALAELKRGLIPNGSVEMATDRTVERGSSERGSEVGEAPPDLRAVSPRKPKLLKGKKPQIGDTVTVEGTTTSGEIIEISGRGDKVCVAIGSVQLWIAKERVAVVKPTPDRIEPVRTYIKMPDVPLELDIRGLKTEEAIARVDRYIADGYAAGRGQLAVIHGKGKGILATNVRNFLKDHPFVQSFKYGEYGEGDYGVTIVEMKKQ